jgi:protein-L-isoaspartate(D-aspartate) O-methyltransferase
MVRTVAFLALAAFLVAACSAEPATETTVADDFYLERRLTMVADQIAARDITDGRVLEAMRSVPRHEFVPENMVDLAYRDHPLPIGHGQTISQPYIVALMTELLEVEAGDKVLEVGTGSGYQAAVLAAMDVEVYTIEIVPELAQEAAGRLDRLGYDASTRQADGYFGWEEQAPFDAIIVTAAPDHVPQPLVQQLAAGGKMVIPVGPIGAVQTMWQFTLDEEGELIAVNLGQVRFVPLTRQ